MGDLGYGTREPLVTKLKQLADDIQDVYEEFLDAETLYQQGKISDKDFFKKMGSFLKAFSSLGFLTVKVILDLNSAIGGEEKSKKTEGGTVPSPTFGPGAMSGASTPQFSPGGAGMQQAAAKAEELEQKSQSEEPTRQQETSQKSCSKCGASIPERAKFCTKCGTKQ